jgi:hypothetical protein
VRRDGEPGGEVVKGSSPLACWLAGWPAVSERYDLLSLLDMLDGFLRIRVTG